MELLMLQLAVALLSWSLKTLLTTTYLTVDIDARGNMIRNTSFKCLRFNNFCLI